MEEKSGQYTSRQSTFIRLTYLHDRRMMPSAKCTHIISSTWLSGSKTQRFLSRKQNRSQVVHPNWIVESVAQGKRLQESKFSVIFHEVSLDSSS